MVESITSIPVLIKIHGTIANTCRETGLSELTIAKYKDDTDCEKHVIYNGRLMSHAKCSRVLYSRSGVTKKEREQTGYETIRQNWGLDCG